MAAAAASMGASDLDHRLQLAGTGDDLDELGRAFNGLLGRLEAAFERQRRFTGDAAHQLSTPLTVLLGQLEVALRRDRSADDYRSAIVAAHGQAVDLRQIVELLLFLARSEADAIAPSKEVVDLTEWLRSYVRKWGQHARALDIQLVVSAGEVVEIAIAPALLRQLLDNLIENACKYSELGTPITVSLTSASGNVSLRVEDVGIGMSAEELAHVFEPFYRSPGARRLGKQGVGLGLAVARRLADALGGTLTATSTPGRGSCFTLNLPVAEPTPRPADPVLASS
jgi:signal transduction histidine kinase